MGKKLTAALLALSMLAAILSGCGAEKVEENAVIESTVGAEETIATSAMAYEIPMDWDYQFASPVVKNFFYVEKEDPWFVEDDNGDHYGYDDRLWDGCSTWCEVTEFYCVAEASSTLAPQGDHSYSVSNLTNQDRGNTWAEGADGDGVGEYVEIRQLCNVGASEAPERLTFTELCIVNGYAENDTKWQENGRVKSLKLYYSGEYMGTISLEDTAKPQFIDLSALNMTVVNGEEAAFRFEIAEVYQGTVYEDTCITGILIEFAGRVAH